MLMMWTETTQYKLNYIPIRKTKTELLITLLVFWIAWMILTTDKCVLCAQQSKAKPVRKSLTVKIIL